MLDRFSSLYERDPDQCHDDIQASAYSGIQAARRGKSPLHARIGGPR